MSRGRPKSHPSGRNLELYHELVCEGRLQVEVAARFRISEPRVTQVRCEVAAWVDGLLPDGRLGAGEAGRRLHLAIALRRLQLTSAYRDYLAQFGGVRGAEGYGHLLAAQDAGVLPPEAAAALPPRTFIETAVRLAHELTDLARVAQLGGYFELPEPLLAAAASDRKAAS